MNNKFKFSVLLSAVLILNSAVFLWAKQAEQTEELKVIESAPENEPIPETVLNALSQTPAVENIGYKVDPLRYTLGPDDVVEITIMRHPEFSGTYPVNLEGKIQYKFIGDIDVTGLTKKELEDKLKQIVSSFVISPEVNVTVLEYRSKVIYILGEVGAPGKYYIRSESIPVREAIVQAGLPTLSAAMRKCRLITPDINNRVKTKKVDIYSILYGGNLKRNIDMHPGDVLYVPSTVMAKVVRMINPVTTSIGVTSGVPAGASTGKSAVQNLQGKPIP